LKGEVRIEQTFEHDAVFEPGFAVILSGSRSEQSAEIEFIRKQHGRCIAKFRGIDTISEAEKLVGHEIKIPAEAVPALDSGWFYTFQLKGCAVVTTSGELIGTVTEVLDAGGSEILKVDRDNVETLIPFAESYMKNIDLARRVIEVDLPEDLRDLNK
jgi:16S rRNA processing protein RimM